MILSRVFFVLCCVAVTWSSNILFLSLTVSRSHTIWDKTLAFALRSKHNITFVTHAENMTGDNVTIIILEGVAERIYQQYPITEPLEISSKTECDQFYYNMHMQSIFDTETKGLQKLIDHVNSGAKYDLIIWDVASGNFVLYYLIEKLNFPPVIATSSFGISPCLTRYFGHDFNSAYIPTWTTAFTDEMNFFQRAYNLASGLYCMYVKENFYKVSEMELAKRTFGLTTETYEILEKHVTLLLMNNDPVMDYPFPVPPSIIPVAGMHLKRPGRIPEDLRRILDDSTAGVILFSLGTNVRSERISIEQRKILLRGFSRLNQTVLWKFESEIFGLPENVIVRQWFPQNEILAHPNVKLFITHCGNLGLQEAMYHGVPVVGIPFFADQFVNMNKIIRKKIGRELSYKYLTEDAVYETITEVLQNPIYRENMKLLSERYRDQPQDSLSKAVFWVEYVLRHKGAEHLQIAAKKLSFVQLNFLDLWLLVSITAALVIFLIIKILKIVYKKCELEFSNINRKKYN